MATHSSVLAWRIPGTAERGSLSSMGSHRVGHDWSDLAVAVAAAAELIILSNHIVVCSSLFLCLQSFLASGSFPMSQLFMWGGQSTGVSALAPFLPKNTQGPISFRMDWLDLLAVQGTLKSLLQHHSSWDWVISGSWWWTGKTWHAAVHGVTKSGTRLSG